MTVRTGTETAYCDSKEKDHLPEEVCQKKKKHKNRPRRIRRKKLHLKHGPGFLPKKEVPRKKKESKRWAKIGLRIKSEVKALGSKRVFHKRGGGKC